MSGAWLADGSWVYTPSVRVIDREPTPAEAKGERNPGRVTCDTDPRVRLPAGARLVPVRGYGASVLVFQGEFCIGWMDTLDIPGGPFASVRAWMDAGEPQPDCRKGADR